MYGAYNRRKNTYVAFHESFDVVDEYIMSLENHKEYAAVKIKNKKFDKFVNAADLYLMEYKGRYIPYKYYESAALFYDQSDYDYRSVIMLLENVAEVDQDLTKKDLRAIVRVVALLREKLDDDKRSTLDPDMLSEIKVDYDTYQGELYNFRYRREE